MSGPPESVFRFFLLNVMTYCSPVDRPCYRELRKAGRLFGYGRLFVR